MTGIVGQTNFKRRHLISHFVAAMTPCQMIELGKYMCT